MNIINMAAEEVLKAAKEKIADPDVIVDAFDMTFQWISPGFSRTLGYSQDEITAKQTVTLHADNPDEARETEMDIISKQEESIREIPVKTKEGKPITVKLKILHFKIGDHPYMVGKLLVD